MILKLMHFWRSRSMENLNFCRNKYQCFRYGGGAFLVNRLCTLTGMSKVDELPEMNESPKLPDWVQFPGGITQDVSNIPEDDDDFVIPSLCEWIENYKLQRQEIGAEGLKKNGAVSDVDEISQTLKKPFKSPDDVLQALGVCNVDLSEGLVERVLKRFSYEWIKSYGFFKWVKLQSNFNLPPYLYNVMIDNLGKTRNFVAMWELVEEMSLLEGYITLETATIVIRRLGKAGCYEDAVAAIPRLEQFGVQKDTNLVNILINALVNGGSVERAHDVYLHEKLHISPNPSTFNMLIHGWCKTRNMEKAKRTIQDMVIHGFSPDSVSYTCLIDAHCRERDFPKVYATLDEMQKKGCPPTVVTYSIVMKALGSAKEHQKALEIYEKMKETGCLDADAYGILINILYSSGRLSDSAKVFEDMTEQGITPNLQTFNVMIRHAAKSLKEEEALKLLKKMEECQCKPDLNTYAQLLKMCCKLKRMKVLSFLMNHMHSNDVAMDIQTYALLIGGLCKIGKHEYACSLFEQSVQKGFLPTDTMYRKLVQELEKKGISEEGERIKQLMIEAGEHNQVKKSEQ